MKKRKYYSRLLMVIHQHNEAMHKIGLLTDEEMREADEDCLMPEPAPSASESSGMHSKPAVAAYAHHKS